jgi:fructokinase
VESGVRNLTAGLGAALPSAEILYDLNLRAGASDRDLVHRLLDLATAAKMNEAEARFVTGREGEDDDTVIREDIAARLAAAHELRAVCMTRGSDGLGLWLDGRYVESAAYPVRVRDSIGAGDAVAAALIHGIGSGWPAVRVADLACRIGALVASRDGAIPGWSLAEAWELRRPTS